MSENTLISAAKNSMNVFHLTNYQTSKLMEYFIALSINDYIYPGMLKSKAHVDIKTIYTILENLKSDGFLQIIYELYCSQCSKSKGIFIECLSDFNADICCDFCDKNLNPLDDTIVLYKVIKL